jgi:hypothetical protein
MKNKVYDQMVAMATGLAYFLFRLKVQYRLTDSIVSPGIKKISVTIDELPQAIMSVRLDIAITELE